MPKDQDMPQGASPCWCCACFKAEPLHGYAIALRIHQLSSEVLQVEEGSFYPALQKMLLKGWVSAEWGISDTNRKVRVYSLTKLGRKQLAEEVRSYEAVTLAIQTILREA